MHCSICHGHPYANLQLLHRIIYWFQNGSRKKYSYLLELTVEREGSFNVDKGIQVNLSIYLVLIQKLDLNTAFGT